MSELCSPCDRRGSICIEATTSNRESIGVDEAAQQQFALAEPTSMALLFAGANFGGFFRLALLSTLRGSLSRSTEENSRGKRFLRSRVAPRGALRSSTLCAVPRLGEPSVANENRPLASDVARRAPRGKASLESPPRQLARSKSDREELLRRETDAESLTRSARCAFREPG